MISGPERRRDERLQTVAQHGIARARVRPGHDVTLVDVAAGGALIETGRRLLPGSFVELLLSDGARSATVRGQVLRCAVARLCATAIAYRGAIGFDRDLSWFLAREGNGYQVPIAESSRVSTERGEATQLLL